MNYDMKQARVYLKKWQEKFKIQDWIIEIKEVTTAWRKSGDIKIDDSNKQAILMLNNFNPKMENLEAVVVHELLHLKLWGMDQMIEDLIKLSFGEDESDPKYQFAFTAFMKVLEPTVEDLAKTFIELGGEDKSISFRKLRAEVEKELS